MLSSLLVPTCRLPNSVTQILGYIHFIFTSVLLESLLWLFCYPEVNVHHTAEALSEVTERLSSSVTAAHKVGASCSKSATDLLIPSLTYFGKSPSA